MTKENKFSFIRNTPIQASSSPKKERSSRRRQINPRKQRKPEAIAIYPEIYLNVLPDTEEQPSTSAQASNLPVSLVDVDTDIGGTASNIEGDADVPAKAEVKVNVTQETPHVEAPPVNSQKMGRPRGKRSNPDYEQVTAYIRRETYTAIKIALLQRGKTRGFSELIEELLTAHLQNS